MSDEDNQPQAGDLKMTTLTLTRGTLVRVLKYTDRKLAEAQAEIHRGTGYWDRVEVEGGLT